VHLLATRLHGVAAARRSGACVTLQVFDGSLSEGLREHAHALHTQGQGLALTARRLDGHVEADLAFALSSVRAAERTLFGGL